eukprot:EST48724.1 Zinc finger domain-containing protein [Spironucleus salmonicida]
MSLEQINESAATPTCGKHIHGLQFKCLTCSNDRNSTYCCQCFDENFHQDHFYTYSYGQGMCDCGYIEAINPIGFCKQHKHQDMNEYLEQEQQNYQMIRLTSQLFYLTYSIQYLVNIILFEDQDTQQIAKSALSIILSFLLQILQPSKSEVIWNVFAKIITYSQFDQNTKIETLLQQDLANSLFYCNSIDYTQNSLTQQFNLFQGPFILMFFAFNNLRDDIKLITNEFQLFLVNEFSGQQLYRQKISELFCFKQLLLVQKMLNKQPYDDVWSNVIAQSHNCINISNQQLQVSQFFEITNIISFIHDFSFCEAKINSNYDFSNIYKELSYEVLSLQDTQICQNITERLEIMFIITRNLQPIDSYQFAVKDQQHILMDQLNKIETFQYSQKQPYFIQQILNGKLTCFHILLSFSFFAYLQLPRFVLRDPQNDEGIYQSLYLFNHQRKQFQWFQFQWFFSQFYQKNELLPQVQKVTQVIQEITYDPKNIMSIKQMIQYLVQLIFIHSKSQQFGFQNSKDHFQKLSRLYLHQYNSKFDEADKNTKETYHQIQNSLTAFLAQILDVYSTYHNQDITGYELPLAELLSIEIQAMNLEVSEVLNTLNIFATNVIVSKSIFQSQGFRRLGEKVEFFLEYIFNQQQKTMFYDAYHQYQLAQQILILNFSYDNSTAVQWFYQTLHLFGFYDFDHQKLVIDENKEDETRKIKMLIDFVKFINIVTFKSLNIPSIDAYVQNYLIQFLIAHDNPTFSQITSAFDEEPYYSPDYLKSMLRKIANEQKAEHVFRLYSTDSVTITFTIKPELLEGLSFYDPFFADSGQLGFYYETQSFEKTKFPACMAQMHEFSGLYQTFLKLPEFESLVFYLLDKLQNQEMASKIGSNALLILSRTCLDMGLADRLHHLQLPRIAQSLVAETAKTQIVQSKISLKSRLESLKSTKQQSRTSELLLNQSCSQPLHQSKNQESEQLKFGGCTICQEQDKVEPLCQLALLQPTSALHRLLGSEVTPQNFIFFEFPQKTLNLALRTVKKEYTRPTQTGFSGLSGSHLTASVFKNSTLCTDFYPLSQNFVALYLNACGHLAHAFCNQKQHIMHSLVCSVCRRVSPIALPVRFCDDELQNLKTVLFTTSQILQSYQQFGAEPIDDPLVRVAFLADMLGDGDLALTREALAARNAAHFTPREIFQFEGLRCVNVLADTAMSGVLLAVLQNREIAQAVNCAASLVLMARFLLHVMTHRALVSLESEHANFELLFDNLAQNPDVWIAQQAEFRFLVFFGTARSKKPFRGSAAVWTALLGAAARADFFGQQHEGGLVERELTVTPSLSEPFLALLRRVREADLPQPNCLRLAFQFTDSHATLLKALQPCTGCAALKYSLVCLFCGTVICLRCESLQRIYYHQKRCFIAGGYYAVSRNLIVIPDLPNFTFLAAGPYRDAGGEADFGAARRCGMTLDQALLQGLADQLLRARTAELDVGRQVVPFARFVRELMQ